jgi:hypothetical protein
VAFIKLIAAEVFWTQSAPDATSQFFILSALAQPFLPRFQHINPFWTCEIEYFHIPKAQNNSIQNKVIIEDGDLTFFI